MLWLLQLHFLKIHCQGLLDRCAADRMIVSKLMLHGGQMSLFTIHGATSMLQVGCHQALFLDTIPTPTSTPTPIYVSVYSPCI